MLGLLALGLLWGISAGSSSTAVNSDTLIAFTSNRDKNGEIYVMNADGSNQKKRIHSALGYLTPVEFEAAWRQAHTEVEFFPKTGLKYVQL